MSTYNQYESQSETTNDIRAFGPTTKTTAKERDRSGTRISAKRKTTTVEGEPEGLPEAKSSIGVFRTMTSKIAAIERDQLETESTVETEEQRQVRREQACINLERQMLSERRIGWNNEGACQGDQGV